MVSKSVLGALGCFFLAVIGLERTLYWFLVLLAVLSGFLLHLILHRHRWLTVQSIYDRIRTSFLPSRLNTHLDDLEFDSPPSSASTHERAPLTGITDIDQSLYELIDLFVRDYIEVWYKTQISSDPTFVQDVKNGISIVARHLAERLHEIDWLDFCTGTVVDSFATHVRLYRKAKERMRLEQSTDIRSCFFDLEAEYERGICRDEVCLDPDQEREFLRDLVEVLIYILLPASEFRCVPVRVLLREVAVNLAFIPFIDMYSDPDAVNQLIIKMCQQIPLTIENFLLIVRTTDSKVELNTLVERLDVEMNRWRSKDTGGENDADIRATLNSYHYLKKLLIDKLEAQVRLEPLIFDEDEPPMTTAYRDLSLAELMNNGNGLEYFLNFLQSIDRVGYANFYLNTETFRCAAINAHQQNITATAEQQTKNNAILRNMATELLQEHFLPTGTLKLPIDEHLVEKVQISLKNETIEETLFDELQSKVFDILSSEKYYGQFKSTPDYLKVLSEIEFTDSLTDNSDAASLSSNNSNDIGGTDLTESPGSAAASVPDLLDQIDSYSITTEINESGVCSDKGEKYAIYVISVCCKSIHGDQRREWITYRRYSEFNDLHMTIKKRFPALKEFIHLPNKNFLNNTSPDVRVKRQKELNDYLVTLTSPKLLHNHPHLGELILKFLRNQQWAHEQTDLARKMDTLVNPFKQASLGIVKGVSKIGGGLSFVSETMMENTAKIFRNNPSLSRNMQTAAIVEDNQAENAKNIPLRVLLVIMDEVFDLKQKTMWFRSRFVSILKGVLRAFMGDSVNRRIAMFVQHWTSAKKIAKEINRFKETMWPNGIRADPNPERDASIQHITQVLCKAKLLGIVSDELRHIIGSETTRRGLLRLFELLQNGSLNRRFVYVVLESFLIKLFRPNELNLIFDKLYSQSSRVKEEYRRRIFEQDHHHGIIHTQQHYGETHSRPYYFSRLTVRTDDLRNSKH